MNYPDKNSSLIASVLFLVVVVLGLIGYLGLINKPYSTGSDSGTISKPKKVPIDIKKLTAEEKTTIMDELMKPAGESK